MVLIALFNVYPIVRSERPFSYSVNIEGAIYFSNILS